MNRGESEGHRADAFRSPLEAGRGRGLVAMAEIRRRLELSSKEGGESIPGVEGLICPARP
ncbi:hypothetical protein HRbin08_00133 [bacterium HR08]|nr:hypothetical protein HRbin08_00133 [bacterium HR08]